MSFTLTGDRNDITQQRLHYFLRRWDWHTSIPKKKFNIPTGEKNTCVEIPNN